MIKTLHCLIIEPNSSTRLRLKEVLKSIILKPEIDLCTDYRSAFSVVANKDNTYEVIFIGSSDDPDDVELIIDRIQKTTKEKPPLIIISLKSNQQESSYIAKLYLKGVQGIVSEPYSTEDFLELLKLTREADDPVSKEANLEKKNLSTFNFLLKDAKSTINRVAIEKIRGNEAGGYASKDFKKIRRSLKVAGERISIDAIEKILVKNFQSETPSKAYQAAMKFKKSAPIVKHPGLRLQELMTKRDLTLEKLAETLKLDISEFEAVLNQTAAITKAVADDLSRVFGEAPVYWLNLQKKFEEANPKWEASYDPDGE